MTVTDPGDATQGPIESEYTGPERRVSTLHRLEGMKTAVEGLRDEVGELNASLGEMTEQHRRDEVNAEHWRRGATWRAAIGGVLILLGFAGFGGLGGYVFANSSDTSRQLNDFKQKSFNSCLIRNEQVKSNVDFFDGLLAILQTTDIGPPQTALTDLVHKQLQEQPAQVDCRQEFTP